MHTNEISPLGIYGVRANSNAGRNAHDTEDEQ